MRKKPHHYIMFLGSLNPRFLRRTLLAASVAVIFILAILYLPEDEGYISRFSNFQDPEPASASVSDNNYKGLGQEDPELINYIRLHIRPPSTEPYHLSKPSRKHFTFMEQSKFVGDLYGPGKREGFFVEVGALDGEESSSTLYLERELGFNGLLIEPNPVNYRNLLSKNRKAYCLQAALSPTTSSAELLFTGSGQQGHLTKNDNSNAIHVKSFPFYSIISALDIPFIDVFNLDIEGFEFKVLKTIPFNKVKVGIWIIEHLNIPEPKPELVKFMTDLGYKKIHQNNFDYIFADPDYLSKLPGWKPS